MNQYQPLTPSSELEDFQTSSSIGKITEALAKAQGAMPAPVKNKKNPHFGSMYADHAAVIECSKPYLSANGLAVIQGTAVKDGLVIITTLLAHISGEWFMSRLAMRPDKTTPQGIGSAITYGRRYGHCAILNMAPDDDDDGNHATQSSPKKEAAKPAPLEPRIYDGSPLEKIWLRDQLFRLAVPEAKWPAIAERMKGKDHSELLNVIHEKEGVS